MQRKIIYKQKKKQHRMIDAKKEKAQATRAKLLDNANGRLNILDIDVGIEENS